MAHADRSGSWDVFTDALTTDVADIQGGTTPEDIHLGATAGTVDVLHCRAPAIRVGIEGQV
jgi:alpha,alpha-trehalase